MKEYRADEFGQLCRSRVRSRRSCWVCSTPASCVLHELALRLGWDSVHRRLGLTEPFYDRFTPAIAASDFALRPERLDGALDFLAVCRT